MKEVFDMHIKHITLRVRDITPDDGTVISMFAIQWSVNTAESI